MPNILFIPNFINAIRTCLMILGIMHICIYLRRPVTNFKAGCHPVFFMKEEWMVGGRSDGESL